MRMTFHRLDSGPSVEIDYTCPGCGATYTAYFETGATESSVHQCSRQSCETNRSEDDA